MKCILPPEHPIFHGGGRYKAGKGDIGEAVCALVLEEYSLEVRNMNVVERNYPGIDLLFNDQLGKCLKSSQTGAVQCRGGIRNPYKHDGTRPEWDGCKIPTEKIARAERMSEKKEAELFYSIAYFYPQDEQHTTLFFFFASNDFMRRYCSQKYGYRFWTHEILERIPLSEENETSLYPEGLLFRIQQYSTQDILEIKERAEKLDIKRAVEDLKQVDFKRMKIWYKWREFNSLLTP